MWFLNLYDFCFAIWPWGIIDILDFQNLLPRCAIGAMSDAMSEAMATAGDSVTTTVNFLLLHGLRGWGKRMVRRMQEMLWRWVKRAFIIQMSSRLLGGFG